jgi:hypothetical protein
VVGWGLSRVYIEDKGHGRQMDESRECFVGIFERCSR